MDGMDKLFIAFIVFGVIDLIGVYISAMTVKQILEKGLRIRKGGK
jgi:hypothetical protein